LRQESCSILTRQIFYKNPFRFQIENISGVQNVVVDGLTRVFHMDLKKISPSVRYPTQRIFRMAESEIEFQSTGSSDIEDNDLEIIKAQDKDSEVKLQKGSVVFDKWHNSVVGYRECDRTYKALKLS